MDGLFGNQFAMVRHLRDRGVFRDEPFVLLDVGCAGGILGAWREFAPDLVAHAFDPMRDECRRLQDREQLPGIRYHAKFVGLPPDHEFMKRKHVNQSVYPSQNPFPRTSAPLACVINNNKILNKNVHPDADMANECELVQVKDFVAQEKLGTVDFLKVDVDGSDFEVLLSAGDVFNTHQILGVGIEVNWHGTHDDTNNTFHNVDRFMRQQGFSIFAMNVTRYSRAALPAQFEFMMFAQTVTGQPLQGDVLYLRDLATPSHRGLADKFSDIKLAKLASLFAMCKLPDCSAELILAYRERFAKLADPDALLNDLVPQLHGEQLTYREHVRQFHDDPARFLPDDPQDYDIDYWRMKSAELKQRLGQAEQAMLAEKHKHAESLSRQEAAYAELESVRSELEAALVNVREELSRTQSSRTWKFANLLRKAAVRGRESAPQNG